MGKLGWGLVLAYLEDCFQQNGGDVKLGLLLPSREGFSNRSRRIRRHLGGKPRSRNCDASPGQTFKKSAIPSLSSGWKQESQIITGAMADSRTRFIVDQVKALPVEERLRVAEAIDRLTWTQRWREICERIARNVASVGAMTDDEIDAEVREVRRETPLSERSSIPRS